MRSSNLKHLASNSADMSFYSAGEWAELWLSKSQALFLHVDHSVHLFIPWSDGGWVLHTHRVPGAVSDAIHETSLRHLSPLKQTFLESDDTLGRLSQKVTDPRSPAHPIVPHRQQGKHQASGATRPSHSVSSCSEHEYRPHRYHSRPSNWQPQTLYN